VIWRASHLRHESPKEAPAAKVFVLTADAAGGGLGLRQTRRVVDRTHLTVNWILLF